MLKLHGFSVSNYTNMVKQCLLEKGIEFEQIDARPSQEDEFLAKSPMGARAKAREIIHVTELYIELAARRHLGHAFFGRERSDEATTEVRPEVEKGLRAFTQLANFGPYVMGSEFGNADVFVYHSFRLASQILKRIYDWDIASEVPGFANYLAAMDERDSTKSVVADNETAMAAMMAQLAAAN